MDSGGDDPPEDAGPQEDTISTDQTTDDVLPESDATNAVKSDAMPLESDAMTPDRPENEPETPKQQTDSTWQRVFGNMVVNATNQGERVYLRLRSWTRENGYKFHGYLGALQSRRSTYKKQTTKVINDGHKADYEAKRGKRGGRRAGSGSHD